MPSLVDYLGLILSPATTPAMGDIPVRGPSGGWTTRPTIVTVLPSPSATYQGAIVTLVGGGAGTADQAYICLQSSTGTWSWKLVATG